MKNRDFMNDVQKNLQNKSEKELRETITRMACSVPSESRYAFLRSLEPVQETEVSFISVLEDVRTLRKSAESGLFSEGWGWDSDYGDEREWGDESWSDDVDQFLREARRFYNKGCYEESLTLYKEVFGILELSEECGHLPGPPDPLSLLNEDIDEAKLLMIRLNYLLAPASERVDVIYREACEYGYSSCSRGLLDGLLGVDPNPLPGFDDFASEWISFLDDMKSELADVLLREVIRITGGIEEVEKYALNRGASNPGFWKDLFTMLQDSGNWSRILELSEKALSSINSDYTIRSKVSDFVMKAAQESGDDKQIVWALREGFYSSTEISRFIPLAIESDRQNLFDEEMNRACCRAIGLNADGERSGCIHTSSLGNMTYATCGIIAWSRLFSGRIDEAIEMCSSDGALGWTRSPSAVVVPILVCVLFGKISPNLLELLKLPAYLPSTFTEKKINQFLQLVIDKGLPAERREEYFLWCSTRAQERVTAIVNGQFRNSYRKAAILAVAIAELVCLFEGEDSARDYLVNWRTTFNRHTAFRSELRKCTATSDLPSATEISKIL